MEVCFIHHKSQHHANNSGYKRILDYYHNAKGIKGNINFPYQFARMLSAAHNQNAGIYNSDSFYKELELLSKLIKSKNNLCIHYLNAERDVRHIVHNSGFFSNAFFSGTFHKPPEILQQRIKNNKYLKKLDGAVAVGENQVDFLKNWLNLDRVTYIPHGIDTEFFNLKRKNKKHHTLIFVGQHLRDFDTLNYCIPILADKIQNLKINMVLRQDFFPFIKPHKSIKLFNNISDEKLKALYDESDALFLPLLNSTACNSILEAMACGLPIITNGVGGVPGYLKGTLNSTIPIGDRDGLIECATDLLLNEEKSKSVGESSRNKARDYDWKVIADRMYKFHLTLSNA